MEEIVGELPSEKITTFNKDWFDIPPPNGDTMLRLKSPVTHKYKKWYYKVINFISFGKLFNECYEYEVEFIGW